MRKFLIAAVIFVMTLASLPTPAQAQYYSPYVYNNNAYLNYAIASQRANATRHKARVSKSKRRTRHTSRLRHSRRSSQRRSSHRSSRLHARR